MSSLPNSKSRIIFGSCNSQLHKEQPLWPVIQSRNATAFIWGGDAVYADDRRRHSSSNKDGSHDGDDYDSVHTDDDVEQPNTESQQEQNSSSLFTFLSRVRNRRKDREKIFLAGDPAYLRSLYDQQRMEPGYRSLLETNISIYGTIDDHDYGINNGDRTFRWRRENTMEFARFLNLPKANSAMERRAAAGYGVYGVQLYDFSREHGRRWLSEEEAGLDPDVVPVPPKQANNSESNNNQNKLVAVFVLDVRTNKTPWKTSFLDRFAQTDVSGDFLGERQWEWFEAAISRSNAAVNVIVTGIQIHAERFYDSEVVENWSGFPTAQHRLHQSLLKSNVQSPILISGDVHKAQLMRKDCIQRPSRRKTNSDQIQSTMIRPLYEVTTSGMTHSWGSAKPGTCGRANTFTCQIYYFQAILRPIMVLAHDWICPWTELLVDENTGSPRYSLDRNVAELEFDWDQRLVNVSILGVDGINLVKQSWSMEQLTSCENSFVKEADFDKTERRLQQLAILKEGSDGDAAYDNEWVCVPYRGLQGSVFFGIATFTFLSSLAFLAFLPIVLLCFTGRVCLRKVTTKRRKKED